MNCEQTSTSPYAEYLPIVVNVMKQKYTWNEVRLVLNFSHVYDTDSYRIQVAPIFSFGKIECASNDVTDNEEHTEPQWYGSRSHWHIWMEIDPVIVVHGLFIVLLQTCLSIDGEPHGWHYTRRRWQHSLFASLHSAYRRLHFNEFIFVDFGWQWRSQVSMPFIGLQTLRYIDWWLLAWHRIQIVVAVIWSWHRTGSMFPLVTLMRGAIQFVNRIFIAENWSFTFRSEYMRINWACPIFCRRNFSFSFEYIDIYRNSIWFTILFLFVASKRWWQSHGLIDMSWWNIHATFLLLLLLLLVLCLATGHRLRTSRSYASCSYFWYLISGVDLCAWSTWHSIHISISFNGMAILPESFPIPMTTESMTAIVCRMPLGFEIVALVYRISE